jgi:hypothetical protein
MALCLELFASRLFVESLLKHYQSIFYLFLLLPLAGLTQPQGPDTLWTKYYHSAFTEIPRSFAVTSDNGYVICGRSDSIAGYLENGFIRKTDSRGNEQWLRRFQVSENSYAPKAVLAAHDGSFVVTGYWGISGVGGGIFISRYNDAGDSTWIRHVFDLNGSSARGITEARDGEYLVAGTAWAADQQQARVVAFDSRGTLLWSQRYVNPPDRNFYPESILPMPDGGFVLVGTAVMRYSQAPITLCVLRASAGGGRRWMHQYEHPEGSLFVLNACGADSLNIVVSCRLEPSILVDPSYAEIFKIDAEGDTVWSHPINSIGRPIAAGAIATDRDHGFIFSVASQVGNYVSLLHLNARGEVEWESDFASPQYYLDGWLPTQLSDGSYSVLIGADRRTDGSESSGLAHFDADSATKARMRQPDAFQLFGCYPNPFNAVTRIKFSSTKSSRISITIYDLLGRGIVTLSDQNYIEGSHEIVFDANNLASGIYFVRMQAGNFIQTRKMVLLK